MREILSGALCMLLSCSALAIPITFTEFTYTTGALAVAAGTIDDNNDASPPSLLPLLSASLANGANGETASAAGIADSGLLSAQADAFGGAGDPSPDGSLGASGLGSSEFLGNFIAPGGLIEFAFTLDASGSSSGTGTNDGLIRVLVISGGTTLLEQTFGSAGFYAPSISLAAGTAASVSLLVLAGADAPATADVATQFASASFAIRTVPEPSVLALLAICVVTGIGARTARGKVERVA